MQRTKERLREQFEVNKNVVLEHPGTGQRSVCHMIGAHDPSYLLVEMPMVQGRPLFMTTQDKCIVRFINEGNIFGFRASIIKIIIEPFPMLILRYPEHYEEVVIRRNTRVDCSLPAQLATASRKAPLLECTICDMSAGGLGLAIPVIEHGMPLETLKSIAPAISGGDRFHYESANLKDRLYKQEIALVTFELPDPGYAACKDVPGEITWTKIEADLFLVGVKFIDETPEDVRHKVRSIILFQQTFFARHVPRT